MDNTIVTEIEFDTEVVDVGEMGATGAGNSITIKRAGQYLVTGSWGAVIFENNNNCQNHIYVNGSLAKTVEARMATGFTNQALTVTITYTAYFSAGDYIDMYGSQGEGSTETISSSTEYEARLSVIEIR